MTDRKPICFVGSSLDDLRAFPQSARRAAGYQLDRVQLGLEPDDWKPMKGWAAAFARYEFAKRMELSGWFM